MAHGPVGVVRQRVHRLHRHHRTFEGRHAVEGQRGDEELQDRVGAQLVPSARQGHHAVDHAAPGRCQQDQREHHAHRLGPVGQRGVVQVVRTRPHVSEDQRPEVDDGQAIGVDRALSLLRHEVVHHAEEARSQEKAHRVVAIPPLHHRILNTGIGRVGLHAGERNRDCSAIDDVQQGHGEDETTEEPVRHIYVRHLALGDGAEEHDGVGNPHHRNQDVDRPLELGVFLRGRVTERQRDCCQHDHELPAPERECGQSGRKQLGVTGALNHVVGRGEQGATAKREDHRVGVKRT